MADTLVRSGVTATRVQRRRRPRVLRYAGTYLVLLLGAGVAIVPFLYTVSVSLMNLTEANGGAWLPEAMQFMRTHQAALQQKPFAAFLVCMTLAMKNAEQYRSHVSTWLDPVRALVRPVSEGLFPGMLEIRKLPSFSDRLKFRLSVLFGAWKEGDHRDWPAVREWAMGLKSSLKL
jgi:hypothetical protein